MAFGRSFQSAKALFNLPPSLRTALYHQQCHIRITTIRPSRLASTASKPSTIQRASNNRPNVDTPNVAYKPTTSPKLTGYANYLDSITNRTGRNEPVLLYKAPPHTNYYVACTFIATCFALAALGSASTIQVGYSDPERRATLWWQLPMLGAATGACIFLTGRVVFAPRKLVKEIWLLPRVPGTGTVGSRIVEIRCRAWPVPVGKDRVWAVPLEDVQITRTYGGIIYRDPVREFAGRHGIAQQTAQDAAAEYKEFMERERKGNGVVVQYMLDGVERVKSVVSEGKQVFNWTGINAWLAVKDNGFFRLDGRGLMLQGGKGLDMLFRQYKG